LKVNVLQGKRALVCGASAGIGKACAIELARLGAEVTLVARSDQALRAALAALDRSAGQTHRYLSGDFIDPAALHAKVAGHIQSVGPHQILINNTGGPPHGALTEATVDALKTAFTQHVLCYQLLVQALLPGMKESAYGRIINIISTSVIQPIKGLGVSNTTRGAVANWGRTLAGELAPFGITVNNILPGYTATERLQSLFQAKAKHLGRTTREIEDETVAAIPMKRLADPLEIGSVAAFLASPAASYVTGVNLPVDGGRTAVQ
jgi:3-oxoacyl-[acyl-carrier protein] reductase